MQRTIDEAHLAAIKLVFVGPKAESTPNFFDQPTTMRLDSDCALFQCRRTQLRSPPRDGDEHADCDCHVWTRQPARKTGRPSITVLDECWFLLDSPALAPEVVQLYRTARKRNSSVWGISQTVEDFVGTEFQPRVHGPGILKNASTKIIGQQPGRCKPFDQPPQPESGGS